LPKIARNRKCPLDYSNEVNDYAPLGKFMRSNGHDFVQSETDSLKIKALANQSNGHFAKNGSSGLE